MNLLRSNNAKHAFCLIKSENKFADFVAIQVCPTATNQSILDSIEVFEIDRQVSNSVSGRKQEVALSWYSLVMSMHQSANSTYTTE